MSSQKSNCERHQGENKLNLDFLSRDDKFWQEKLEKLAKLLTISDENPISDVSKYTNNENKHLKFSAKKSRMLTIIFHRIIIVSRAGRAKGDALRGDIQHPVQMQRVSDIAQPHRCHSWRVEGIQ